MTREEFEIEAAKHTSNWLIGEPLEIGKDENGHPLEVLMHDPGCPYCAVCPVIEMDIEELRKMYPKARVI